MQSASNPKERRWFKYLCKTSLSRYRVTLSFASVSWGTIPISVLPMNDPHAGGRNISDSARWMAYFRAMESRRPGALFRDPYAEALAGERGFQIATILSEGNQQDWACV